MSGTGDSGGPVYYRNAKKQDIALGLISGAGGRAALKDCGEYPNADTDQRAVEVKCSPAASVIPISSALAIVTAKFKSG
ncbi:MAG: hypothetical protein L0Y54_00955 [Sporichthyaceae bacterium]|nr:hypothetical protein [Sporichthyaceae bacterium]